MDVRYSKAAARALIRSNKRALLKQKIDALAAFPLALDGNIVRLQGRPEYRLRVQDWRIIFRIEDETLWVDDIAPRGSVY
jgi:mRNA interferase RelE/StbE